jgi:Dyp-type peroxidase family
VVETEEREAPIPDPLQGIPTGPSHPEVPEEPVLNANNIQGNILAGFNKDHQFSVFLRIVDPQAFKDSLNDVIPFIATLAEVVTFNRLFKAMRVRLNREPSQLKVTWANIAFTFEGIQRLAAGVDPEIDTDFEDEAFVQGLVASSPDLGDPTDPDSEGNPANWNVLDGPDDGVNNDRIAHAVVLIAGDDHDDAQRLRDELIGDPPGDPGLLRGVAIAFEEEGENLPADPDPGRDLKGHEHFGFLDGVSQPGVRGRLSENAHDVLTIRQNPNNRDQGKPGQELIWPGEFVFGYPGGEGDPEDDPQQRFEEAGPVSTAGPEWANDGSFLVFRRLRQDVAAFHHFLHDTAAALGVPAPGGAGGGAAGDLAGSKLVGRWRTGAPILRTPDQRDNPALGNDDCANNNFEFQESTEPLEPTAFNDPFDCTDEIPNSPGDLFPAALRDRKGGVCPFTGHIRKVYPRDDRTLDPANPFTKLGDDFVRTVEPDPESEDGEGDKIKLNEDDTQSHRIMRRGIPFGEPLLRDGGVPSTPGHPADDDSTERGLHFLAYQTSIEDQFEFIVKNWVNNPDFKEPKGADVPNGPVNVPAPEQQGGGHDPIIGQNNTETDDEGKETRRREFTVTFKNAAGQVQTRRVSTRVDWVIPTGGGYFLAPSITALEMFANQ